MCLNPVQIHLPSINSYRWLRGERSPRYIDAPCGHCVDCLRKKQNDLSARLYQESKTKSRCYFITFTYAPEHEPYSGSLWIYEHAEKKLRKLTDPVLLDHENENYKAASKYFSTLSIPKSGVTRIFKRNLPIDDLSFLSDTSFYEMYCNDENTLLMRVTPSLNIRHPRLAIKRWRINYLRNFGKSLPDFSYCLVGEFGLKNTRRPHYHMVIFSNELEKWQVQLLVDEWHYGRTQLDVVQRYNQNGSDAFASISRYIGKYLSKGDFDVESVKQGLVKGVRVCTSKHLGQTLSKSDIDYYTCQDMKKFNQDYAFKELTEEDKKVILPEISRRLRYKIYTKRGNALLFAMPQSLKKQIFNYHVSKTTGEASYSSLYYMVADFVRSEYIESCSREFVQFSASRPPGEDYSKTVSLFNKFKEMDRQNRKKVLSEGLQSWYNNHSKF